MSAPISNSFAEPALHSVVIAPYDPSWARRATEEAAVLEQALGDNFVRVEHIGSTSVEGLAAKPILDLMPLVHSLDRLDQQRAAIEAIGYAWHGEFGIEGRRYGTKTDAKGTREVNLHCFQIDSPQIQRHLVFRDYLRLHPAVAREYETEKRRVAGLHPDDSRAYNDGKWAWVARVEAEALRWHAARANLKIAL